MVFSFTGDCGEFRVLQERGYRDERGELRIQGIYWIEADLVTQAVSF